MTAQNTGRFDLTGMVVIVTVGAQERQALMAAEFANRRSTLQRITLIRGRGGSARAHHSLSPRARTHHDISKTALVVRLLILLCLSSGMACDADVRADGLIGYTTFRTNLPGGRHFNVRTNRAAIITVDGSGHRMVAEQLVDDPHAWTQFAGWSPDGNQAIVCRGWQDPLNAEWEEENKVFRMLPGKWQLDCCLVELSGGELANVTAVERISHYNGGVFFLPNGRGLGFTALIDGVSKPFVMDLDGRNKRDVSDKDAGFTYGYSASPDGELISYHENYQVYIANADGSEKRHIQTNNPFDFAPSWSSDGEWLLFVSGVHEHWNPHIVRRDGTGLRKLADLGSYQGWISFLDVPDFHNGSSDIPVWSADGRSVYYTAQVADNVELFQVTLDGTVAQLTHSDPGTLHYHIKPSADGRRLLYGSKRHGVRNLFVMDLAVGTEVPLTNVTRGHGAMWPHWQP